MVNQLNEYINSDRDLYNTEKYIENFQDFIRQPFVKDRIKIVV